MKTVSISIREKPRIKKIETVLKQRRILFGYLSFVFSRIRMMDWTPLKALFKEVVFLFEGLGGNMLIRTGRRMMVRMKAKTVPI